MGFQQFVLTQKATHLCTNDISILVEICKKFVRIPKLIPYYEIISDTYGLEIPIGQNMKI